MKKFCPVCNETVSAEEQECPVCEATLLEGTPKKKPAKAKKKK